MTGRLAAALAAVLVAAAGGCRSISNVAPSTVDASRPGLASPSPAGATPQLQFDHDLAAAPFHAGRYTVAVQRTLLGTRGLQAYKDTSTATLAIELAADGTASACRGVRDDTATSGPDGRGQDHASAEQGYRGRYAVDGGVAQVTLAADDTACPRVADGRLPVRPPLPNLALRCALATPSGSSQLATPSGDSQRAQPVLLCQHADQQPPELDPYVVRTIAPAGWFALGGGNGVRVWVTGKPSAAPEGDEATVTVKPADSPIGPDAWRQPF